MDIFGEGGRISSLPAQTEVALAGLEVASSVVLLEGMTIDWVTSTWSTSMHCLLRSFSEPDEATELAIANLDGAEDEM